MGKHGICCVFIAKQSKHSVRANSTYFDGVAFLYKQKA